MAADERRASDDDVVEAVVASSRALVALAARSLAGATEDVTLPQYRALVLVVTHGGRRVVDLAEALDVNTSTATRMCDRLVRKGLVARSSVEGDRRATLIAATDAGEKLVAAVMQKRRNDVRAIVRKLTPEEKVAVVSGLARFATAAGEGPEQAWSMGWTT